MPVPSLTAPWLLEVLRRRVADGPARPSFTFVVSHRAEAETLTLGELDGRARAAAVALQEAGTAGGRARILYPTGLGFIASLLECLYAEATAGPFYPPRRNRPPDGELLVIGCTRG